MKNTIKLFTLSIFVTLRCYSQTEIKVPIEQLGFNKNTIVINENGVKYDYPAWAKLINTGGYMLKPIEAGSDSTEFILLKINNDIEKKMFYTQPKPDETQFFKNGEVFDFTDLKDINGVVTKAKDLKGKIVILNFWFIACPPCRYEIPELNKLVEEYRNRTDIVFYAITLDNRKNVESFLKVSPFNYHVISDSWSLFTRYKISGCPASVVIDKNGVIKFNSLAYGNGSTPYWIKQTILGLK